MTPDEPGSRRFRDLLARERQDMAWLVHVVAVMYDDISGGRISKPMTFPSEVIAAYNQQLIDEWDKAEAAERTRFKNELMWRDEEQWRKTIETWLGPQRLSMYTSKDINRMAQGAVVACAILADILRRDKIDWKGDEIK